jgi:hypothetical protein
MEALNTNININITIPPTPFTPPPEDPRQLWLIPPEELDRVCLPRPPQPKPKPEPKKPKPEPPTKDKEDTLF